MGVSSNWKTRLKIKINEKITENEIRYFLDLSNYKKILFLIRSVSILEIESKLKQGHFSEKKSGPRTI